MLRLGLDIGTNSIGWWLYNIAADQPSQILDGGARIFSNGRVAKTGASLAVDRRNARAMRRRRDRYLRRRAMLMKRLAGAGLMPADPVEAKALELLDPFALRAAGLDQVLPLTHLGRALFHLDQRRGFKSNRKTDGGDNEGGKIKDGSARLDQAMMAAGARTYGEFLHKRRAAAPDLSGYRLMWILVMFDLPTDTKPQRKAAGDFRHFLLDEGFERCQFSIYARFVNGKEAFDTRVRHIERSLPDQGDIQILNFTDRQYRDIIHFSDQGRRGQRKNPEQLVLF